MSGDYTDFGFERVSPGDKTRRVARVFGSVAARYDLMNDLMSFGLHRLWKRYFLARMGLRRGEHVLDIAAGTGDISILAVAAVEPTGQVVLCEPSAAMLSRGRDRLLDAGHCTAVACVQAPGEALPFADASFDAVTIAFGLRNLTDKARGLAEMFRVLRPGGRLGVLEFSRLVVPRLERLYERYSFEVIPWVGERVTGDRAAYEYLVESIRMHPDQRALGAMMGTAGFERVRWHNLSAGVVAVHLGHRL
ncbi:MAG: class I SAM-dependent methyltransferase [Gammaproteobacteria bacterium]|nr:class I SAM-dependent methyltransferase [Gammaproteobacteria bacterium]